MHDYRLHLSGLNDDLLVFRAEVLVDDDTASAWVAIQDWTVVNPHLAARERNDFVESAAAAHGWSLLHGRRRATKGGDLYIPIEPSEWELVLADATAAVDRQRLVERAWHNLIADTPLPVVRVGEIAGFGRHRVYQIQNNINGPRGRRRSLKN